MSSLFRSGVSFPSRLCVPSSPSVCAGQVLSAKTKTRCQASIQVLSWGTGDWADMAALRAQRPRRSRRGEDSAGYAPKTSDTAQLSWRLLIKDEGHTRKRGMGKRQHKQDGGTVLGEHGEEETRKPAVGRVTQCPWFEELSF